MRFVEVKGPGDSLSETQKVGRAALPVSSGWRGIGTGWGGWLVVENGRWGKRWWSRGNANGGRWDVALMVVVVFLGVDRRAALGGGEGGGVSRSGEGCESECGCGVEEREGEGEGARRGWGKG